MRAAGAESVRPQLVFAGQAKALHHMLQHAKQLSPALNAKQRLNLSVNRFKLRKGSTTSA